MSYSNKEMLKDLHGEFSNVRFDFQIAHCRGDAHCFFAFTDSESLLAESWMKISDLIALNYQSRLTDEFTAWNLYLFFITQEAIQINLKYLIENDTFSSRKIVIDSYGSIEEIINEHILNRDIALDGEKIVEKIFKPNGIIFNEIKNLEAKSRVTDSLKEAYTRIQAQLKENENEI